MSPRRLARSQRSPGHRQVRPDYLTDEAGSPVLAGPTDLRDTPNALPHPPWRGGGATEAEGPATRQPTWTHPHAPDESRIPWETSAGQRCRAPCAAPRDHLARRRVQTTPRPLAHGRSRGIQDVRKNSPLQYHPCVRSSGRSAWPSRCGRGSPGSIGPRRRIRYGRR